MDLSKVEPASNEGKTNSWYTPRWILDACGTFQLDPCGDKRWSTANVIYESKGLELNWFGRVWMNPPYGRHVGKWVDKFCKHANGVCLLYARTDTKWFQDNAIKFDWVLFIDKRVKFVESNTLQITKNSPGAPSMLCGIDSDVPKIKGQLFRPDSSYGFSQEPESCLCGEINARHCPKHQENG